MKSIVKRVLGRVRESESGFTLIEMLIVVGIIVALAAAIVPQVVQFGGKGKTAQDTAEQQAIQVAIDAMLAETLAGSVTASASGGNAVNDWTANPVGGTLVTVLNPSYFNQATTTMYYCWDSVGSITLQVEAANATGACP